MGLLKINPDNTAEKLSCPMDLANSPKALEVMQAGVGGYIERVPLPALGHTLIANEEGLIQGLQPNPIATWIRDMHGGQSVVPLVGPILLTSIDWGHPKPSLVDALSKLWGWKW